MKAAIARADERAHRAWALIPEQGDATIDPFVLQVVAGDLKAALAKLEALTQEKTQ